MADLINTFQDFSFPDTHSAQSGELPTRLDRLLLTVPSIAALYPLLADFLLQIVEVDGVWLGAPDEQEAVAYHFVAGEGVQEFLAGGTIRINDNPDSALALAWRTGVPQFTLDWTDRGNPSPGAFWRERGLRFGWRSSCAIPVSGSAGNRDILILYSKRANFFAEEQIQQFVHQLHSLLGFALERLRLLETMQKSQQTLMLYKTAMDASANSILIAEAVGDWPIRYVNPAFERITGYSADEAIGRNCRFLQGTDRNQPQLAAIRKALKRGKPCAVEVRNYRKNGIMFWNSLSIAPVTNDAGATTHFVGIQQDITRLKSALNENAHSNALYRALMAAAEAVIGAQSERQLLDELCRLLVENGLFALTWICRPNTSGDLEIQAVYNTINADPFSACLPNVHTGDEERILSVRAWRRSQLQFTNDRLTDPDYPPIQDFYRRHDLHATAVVPLYRDGEIWALLTLVSREANIFHPELVELIERIGRLVGHGLDSLDLRHILDEERKSQSWLARHDPLTDILNRRGLTERIEEGIVRSRQQNRSMAVALLDLNDFRILNDLHGHPACDLLLRTVAERLQEPLGPADAVGRLGGDEFVLVLEGFDHQDDLAVMLSRIQASVEQPIRLANGRAATLRTSMGVTVFPQDDSTPEHLLRHADRALDALKEVADEAGPRWMIFQAEVDEQKRLYQKKILALFRKGSLRVHYQPIVNLQTGSVTKVEALARLVDGNGLLWPAEFLPHFGPAELTALTFQVLAQGVQDIHRLEKAGFHLTMGINFEPVTLADPKAMLELRQQIEASGVSANRIVLELLERPGTLTMAGAQEALLALKTCGVRIALDDVGSAYSSLLRVKELPIDTIKLDRCFLTGLERHPKELRLLMNLVNLAQALGLGLIAEGIESNVCRDALAALGVQHAQGYAIAMPMEAEELEAWLRGYQPVAWTGPTSLLGAVALQLRDLDAAARILAQHPSFLKHLVSDHPDFEDEFALRMGENQAEASKLFAAHRVWRGTMSSLLAQSRETIDPVPFQAARAAYEEEMFCAVLEAAPCSQENSFPYPSNIA